MITIIPLNDKFEPVKLKEATKAKVLEDPDVPIPYFIKIGPGYEAPEGVRVLEPEE